MARPPRRRAIRPSCGSRVSAMSSDVEPGHDLQPRDDPLGRHVAAVEDVLHGAVDPHPGPQAVLVRFQMQVRRGATHRLSEQLVDQPDHRRVLGIL